MNWPMDDFCLSSPKNILNNKINLLTTLEVIEEDYIKIVPIKN